MLFSGRIESWLNNLEKKKKDRKDRKLRFYELVLRTYFYFLIPTSLFKTEESMKIRMSRKKFTHIMKHQLKRYELDTVAKREKVSALIENMKKEKISCAIENLDSREKIICNLGDIEMQEK